MGILSNLLRMGLVTGAGAIPGIGAVAGPMAAGAMFGPTAGIMQGMGNMMQKSEQPEPPQVQRPMGIPGVPTPMIGMPGGMNFMELIKNNPQLLASIFGRGGMY